jgi:hypothetical protein
MRDSHGLCCRDESVGPVFVILFWAILLTPVGLVIGGTLSFLGPFTYYRARRVPPEKRKRGWAFRARFTAVFTLVFVQLMCAIGLVMSYWGSGDYWNYQGAFDYWRMPLEPPYELVMVDGLADASIHEWKDGSAIVWGISEYERRGALIAGTCEPAQSFAGGPGWFLFDCTNGAVTRIRNQESFEAACANGGFAPPVQMKSIRENWNSYWCDPNRRRR